MCPLCATTLALTIAGVPAAGGMTALVVSSLRPRTKTRIPRSNGGNRPLCQRKDAKIAGATTS